MEALTVEQLNRKMEVLFNYEKDLAKELKKNSVDTAEVQAELSKVNSMLLDLQHKVDLLMDNRISLVKKAVYSDEEIYKVRMSTSLSKAAEALGISKSSVQRACRRYTSKIMDFDV